MENTASQAVLMLFFFLPETFLREVSKGLSFLVKPAVLG